MKRANLVGERFGKLVVIGPAQQQDHKNFKWECVCDCGKTVSVPTCHLRSGHTRSCRKCQSYTEQGGQVKCTTSSGDAFIIDKADVDVVRKYTWSKDSFGYFRAWDPARGTIKLHRLLMGLDTDAYIDHANGDRTDNRRCNLRFATPTQNAQNTAMHKGNVTGYKGVYRHSSGKYAARICVDKKQISLGYFDSALDAAQAYNAAASANFGAFARINHI